MLLLRPRPVRRMSLPDRLTERDTYIGPHVWINIYIALSFFTVLSILPYPTIDTGSSRDDGLSVTRLVSHCLICNDTDMTLIAWLEHLFLNSFPVLDV